MQKTDVVAGLPAPVAVQFLRHFMHGSYESRHSPRLDAQYGSEAEVLERLAAEGLVELTIGGRDGARGYWTNTIDGNSMAMVKFTKPITRATAERLLAGAIERATAFNADPTKLATIRRLRVFGSYLDDAADRLGDLDLAVSIERRREISASEAQDYARAMGKTNSIMEMLFWPTREPLAVVKNRSRGISLTTGNPALFTERWRDVFVADGVEANPTTPPVDDDREDW